MDKLQECFLKLLSNGLNNRREAVDCKIEGIENLARTHICLPFVYFGVKNAGIEVPNAWKNYIVLNLARNQLNLKVQDDVINTLKENDIACAVIKGSTVSVNYPEPYARTLGDVDILVDADNYDRAIDILCAGKYEDESIENHKFHYRYTVNGITVEIHKQISEYSSEKYGYTISKVMESALDSVVLKRIDEFEFPSLSNKYQALTLLIHMQRHFYENLLPIRMLCDWSMFVKSVELTEWTEEVYPFVKSMGLDSFCDALTAVCNKYLGLNCEEKVLSFVDEKTIENVILEFFNDGVIKDKKEISQNIGSAYTQYKIEADGKIKPIFMIINKIARNEFMLARVSSLFLPIFWCYIPIRYLFRYFTGKRKLINVSEFNNTIKRKDDLIKKLKLKE